MKRPLALVLLAVVLTAAAHAAPKSGFDAVLVHYESVRQALLADRWDRTTIAAAAQLRAEAAAVAKAPTAESAAVLAAKVGDVEALLPEVDRAAAALAGANDLAAAREAFYRLSMPLVRWRGATGRGPAVAFCPMAKKSWLQPPGQIGNPYMGKGMLRCGELVK